MHSILSYRSYTDASCTLQLILFPHLEAALFDIAKLCDKTALWETLPTVLKRPFFLLFCSLGTAPFADVDLWL